MPIIGTTYQMANPEALKATLSQTMETMIGINQTVGYLADHGTLALSPGAMGMMPGQPRSNMKRLQSAVVPAVHHKIPCLE